MALKACLALYEIDKCEIWQRFTMMVVVVHDGSSEMKCPMIGTKRLVLFHVLPTLNLTDSANKSKHAKKYIADVTSHFSLLQKVFRSLEDQLKSTYAFFPAEIRGS